MEQQVQRFQGGDEVIDPVPHTEFHRLLQADIRSGRTLELQKYSI